MHKVKMKEVFADPANKTGKHFGEILLLKAVYLHLKGNSDKAVDVLIEAVKHNAKCVDSLEVNFDCELSTKLSFNTQIRPFFTTDAPQQFQTL